MKILEFKYKKEPEADFSDRMFLALKDPFPDYAGYDLSQMSEEDYCYFVDELKQHQEEFNNLITSFDLRKSYRRFKPDKMTDLTVIDL